MEGKSDKISPREYNTQKEYGCDKKNLHPIER
jgi:hypothetical protein